MLQAFAELTIDTDRFIVKQPRLWQIAILSEVEETLLLLVQLGQTLLTCSV